MGRPDHFARRRRILLTPRAAHADRTPVDRLAELLESTPPARVGCAIRDARAGAGRTRRSLARTAGLRARRLRALERGRRAVSPTELRAIATALDLDVRALLPPRHLLPRVDTEHARIVVGGRVRPLPVDADERDILRAYLQLVRELRNRAPDEPLPLRDDDLKTLADALGGTPQRIEASLVALMDIEAEEAGRLRAVLDRPVRAPVAGAVLGDSAGR